MVFILNLSSRVLVSYYLVSRRGWTPSLRVEELVCLVVTHDICAEDIKPDMGPRI